VTLWWNENDPDDLSPQVSRQDIVAWRITTSYSDTKREHVSSAEPICPDFILDPVDGTDAAIICPSGVAVVVAHDDYPSIKKWIEARLRAT
jgi:hypothetical protein